jgi:hypothetical protein
VRTASGHRVAIAPDWRLCPRRLRRGRAPPAIPAINPAQTMSSAVCTNPITMTTVMGQPTMGAALHRRWLRCGSCTDPERLWMAIVSVSQARSWNVEMSGSNVPFALDDPLLHRVTHQRDRRQLRPRPRKISPHIHPSGPSGGCTVKGRVPGAQAHLPLEASDSRVGPRPKAH